MELPGKHQSLWIETAQRPRFQPQKGLVAADVAVIGGGIAGLTAATLLKRAGRTVAVVEMGRVAAGESGRTTAHLTQLVDARYRTVRSRFGAEGARLVADSGRAALEKVVSLATGAKIACGLRRVPGFLYTESEAGVPELEAELASSRRAGLDVSLTKEVPLPFPVKAALRLENQAQFHPREYLLPLAEAVAGGGSHVFELTRMVEIEEGEPCRVRTDLGTITARDVVVATNNPASNRVLLQTKIASYRTYALAVRTAELPPPGLYWDTENPYHYIRFQETKAGIFLLVGGEDNKTGQEPDTESRYRRLEEYARSRFKVESTDYRWSGQIIEPVDGLPLIGWNPGSRHVYVATGFSGTGMTFGTLAGMIVSDLILERANPWAELYDPARVKPLAQASRWLSENINAGERFLVDHIAAPEGRSAVEVGPGEGKVVSSAGKRMAVHRDSAGTVHAVSAVCTHLGCVVAWNGAEKSWDCPCHGSRYDVDGRVLNSPAVKDLGPAAAAAPPARTRRAING